MRHSYTARSDAVRAGLAEGTQFWFGVPRSTPALTRPALLAAGYLISTAEDLGAYLQLYLRGGRTADGRQIISTRSLQTMLTPASTAQLGSWADGASARYAMGWFIGGPWNPPLAFHSGNSPDTSAMIAVSASTSTAVATLIGASHEMPVPGNPAATDRASRNAIAAALGQPRHPGPSVRSFYIAFDLTCLALILLTGADLTRTGRTRHWRRRRRVGQAISWSGAAARLVLAAGLLALPMLIGYGWNGAWTWAPDLTLATGLIAVLLGASGVRHATVTWRHLKQQPPLTFPQAPADLSR
jgi:hypothetical protein